MVRTESCAAAMRFKTQPYKHQIDCLNRFGRKHAFALLAEMGTGKTWIAINNLADLWSSGDCDGALVLAPNGVHTNWTRIELPRHTPVWCRYTAAAWYSAPSRAERAALDGLFAAEASGTLRILAMNHEALQTKRGMEFAERFLLSCAKAAIVVDESDAYKNPSALRTKNLMKLRKHSLWRRIMSGTPITGAPFDAFAQFNFLDEHILGTSSFYAFKAEYAELLPESSPLMAAIRQRGARRAPQIVARGAGGRPKYRNLDKRARLIEPHSFRVLKSDCLDLPPKIYKTVFFELTPQQRAVYKKARDECRLAFENEETPFNKLIAVTKLAQVTSGYYLHPLAEEPVRLEGANPKLDALMERISSIVAAGNKAIIWARYRVEIEDICRRLREAGIECVEYHGGIGKAERVEALDAFEHGAAQVFVGNQQAGGTGITLVAAAYVVYFSNNFSLRDRLQSEDRAHRIGQRRTVTYINLAAKGTVDEAVLRALAGKQDVAAAIVDSIRQESQ